MNPIPRDMQIGRLRRWSRTGAQYLASQGLAQIAGMLVGLIYVRFLPIEQYAIYAIFLTALGMISLCSDLGVGACLIHFWHRHHSSPEQFGRILDVVRKIRFGLLAFALSAGSFFLLQSIGSQQISITMVVVCFVVLGFTSLLSVHNNTELVVARLEARQTDSYAAEVAGHIGRLTVAIAVMATGFATALFALAGGLVGSVTTAVLLRRCRSELSATRFSSQRQDWQVVGRYTSLVAPAVLISAALDPLVVWLATTQVGLQGVAESFALGRITAIYGIIGGYSGIVFGPQLARMVDRTAIARMVGTTIMVVGATMAGAITFTWMFPAVPLWLLGGKYAHLTQEIVLATVSSAISTVAVFLVTANRMRGWVAADTGVAVIQIIVISIVCWVVPLASTSDILTLQLGIAAVGLLGATLVWIVGCTLPHWVNSSGSEAN